MMLSKKKRIPPLELKREGLNFCLLTSLLRGFFAIASKKTFFGSKRYENLMEKLGYHIFITFISPEAPKVAACLHGELSPLWINSTFNMNWAKQPSVAPSFPENKPYCAHEKCPIFRLRIYIGAIGYVPK